MCHSARTGLSDEHLLDMCIGAWPVIVFKKQLKDNSRKYMEIFEATGVEDGKLRGRTLYKFVISETERDGRGHVVKVHGSHQRVGAISPKLFARLRDNGAPETELRRLFPESRQEADAK
jgi:pilus assembly protein CpaF